MVLDNLRGRSMELRSKREETGSADDEPTHD